MSVIVKDGITTEQLMELLAYSLAPECQFIFPIKPLTNISNDHVFQSGSAIKFLKVEPCVHSRIDTTRTRVLSNRFNVKICIEDNFWQKTDDQENYVSSGVVPTEIKLKVTEILG